MGAVKRAEARAPKPNQDTAFRKYRRIGKPVS
jgi:hypothetical protein